ncbi:HD domain-containing protein [Halobacillus litoralis]|uniref:HD domain-containing protein n=1 Tax=Halobacillus litoralis TaxID=45668 RepID=UPI001CD2ED9C|nr:HD domain-containing protein [Halobacillus litoralis]MCA0970405.1 HD domain-containing protein [Halobacillus litoralis]
MDSGVIQKALHYIQPLFEKDATGHDLDHMKRVARWSRELALREGADPTLAELAGLLHDVDDAKLSQNPDASRRERREKLLEWGLSDAQVEEIEQAIETVSFRKGKVPASTLGKVLQDADRLDAMGAVGIARTFAFGGAKGQMIHSDDPGAGTSVQHFHDKLLHLLHLMNTDSGRQEAEHRHETMTAFLNEFNREYYALGGKSDESK